MISSSSSSLSGPLPRAATPGGVPHGRPSPAADADADGLRLRARRRRRRSRLVAGVATVATCLLAFLAVTTRVLGGHEQVLALARGVPAGSALTDADVTVVELSTGSGVVSLPAGEQSAVIGRTAAVPLTAGMLLTAADLGPSRWPPPGRAIVPVALGAGALPTGVEVGARVAVLPGASTAQGGGTLTTVGAPVVGLVEAVTSNTGTAGGSVVSLLVDAPAAPVLASVASPVLVVLDPGGVDVP